MNLNINLIQTIEVLSRDSIHLKQDTSRTRNLHLHPKEIKVVIADNKNQYQNL